MLSAGIAAESAVARALVSYSRTAPVALTAAAAKTALAAAAVALLPAVVALPDALVADALTAIA